MIPHRQRALWLSLVLGLSLPLLVLIATAYSPFNAQGSYGIGASLRVMFTELHLSTPGADHDILKLRLIRALCALGVGGSLGLAGAMTQGLFRNPLAEPSLLGIGSGATLGAVLGIAMLGGYGPNWAAWIGRSSADTLEGPLSNGIVPMLELIGALATSLSIYKLASRGGSISVPQLLLTGLAVNSFLGSLMAALQVLILQQDWQVSRAILAWGFGTLDDRTPFHLVVVTCGALIALGSIPFVGLELDLLASGEDDAAALGANPARIKTIVLSCVALATAAAVSVSGQIAFVGLLIPQLVRMVCGPHHRILMPVSFLAGAWLLVSIIVFQDALCPALSDWSHHAGMERLAIAFSRVTVLQPGVLTSLAGAPFFMYLLSKQRKFRI